MLAAESLLVVAVCGLVVALAAALPKMVVGDTWLALVDGRWIAQHGLPHSDAMAVWTHGRQWVDQQWLAHLALYEVVRVGGMKLALALAATLDTAALVLAAVASRRWGASPRSAAACVTVAVIVAPWFLQARTQSFALVLFVAVYALLVADARRPSNRVFVVVPLLVLWENLHGSAALGALLVFVYGLLAAQRRLRHGLVLAGCAPLTILATPYGLDIVGYYHRMLIGSPLPDYVNEWGPTTPELDTAAFYAVAALVVYLLARRARSVSLFERAALPLLVAVGMLAGRNTGWLGLAFAVSAPALLDAEWSPSGLAPERRRPNLILATIALAVCAVAVGARLAESQSTLLSAWPESGAQAVVTAAGPDGRVLADDLHSDWLLWTYPELTGRIAFDIRFELLDKSQLASLKTFRSSDVPAGPTKGYRVFTFAKAANAARLRDGRVVYRSTGLVVLRRD